MTLSLLKSNETLDSLNIKPLFGPKPVAHPDHQWITREYIKWSKKYSDYKESINEILINFTSFAYNKCLSKEKLFNVLIVNNLIVSFDPTFGPIREKKSANEMREMAEKLNNVIENRECVYEFAFGQRLLQCLESLENDMSSEEFTQFKHYIKDLIASQVYVHCDIWFKDNFLPIDKYVEIRVIESGWTLLLFMLRYGLNYVMPDEVRCNEHMIRFNDKVIEFCLAVDDLYSFKSKLKNNDITNHIITYAFHKKCSLQESIDYHYNYTIELEKECKNLANTIQQNQNIICIELTNYLNAAINWSYSMYSICYSDNVMDANRVNETFDKLY